MERDRYPWRNAVKIDGKAMSDTELEAQDMEKNSLSNPAAEILAREVELMEAKNHPDFVANPLRILSFYDTDALRHFDLNAMQLEGKEVGEMFAAVSPTFIGQATIHDVRANAEGSIGFASLIEVYDGHLRDTGDHITLTFRMTHGWRKVDGQWLIVHEHWSYPVDPATGVARINDPLP